MERDERWYKTESGYSVPVYVNWLICEDRAKREKDIIRRLEANWALSFACYRNHFLNLNGVIS